MPKRAARLSLLPGSSVRLHGGPRLVRDRAEAGHACSDHAGGRRAQQAEGCQLCLSIACRRAGYKRRRQLGSGAWRASTLRSSLKARAQSLQLSLPDAGQLLIDETVRFGSPVLAPAGHAGWVGDAVVVIYPAADQAISLVTLFAYVDVAAFGSDGGFMWALLSRQRARARSLTGRFPLLAQTSILRLRVRAGRQHLHAGGGSRRRSPAQQRGRGSGSRLPAHVSTSARPQARKPARRCAAAPGPCPPRTSPSPFASRPLCPRTSSR